MSRDQRGYQPTVSAAELEPPRGRGASSHRSTPNVRIHLRSGQTIETRAAAVVTEHSRVTDQLVNVRLRDVEPGWPELRWIDPSAVTAIEGPNDSTAGADR